MVGRESRADARRFKVGGIRMSAHAVQTPQQMKPKPDAPPPTGVQERLRSAIDALPAAPAQPGS